MALSQNGVAEQTIAYYGYDLLARRIWIEQYASRTGVPLAQRTLYLYGDQGLLAQATQSFSVTDASIPTTALAITTQYGQRPDGPWGTGQGCITVPLLRSVKIGGISKVGTFAA